MAAKEEFKAAKHEAGRDFAMAKKHGHDKFGAQKVLWKCMRKQPRAKDVLNEHNKNKFKEGLLFAYFDGDGMGEMKSNIGSETAAEKIFEILAASLAIKKVHHIHGDEFAAVVSSVEEAEEIVRYVREIKTPGWHEGLTITGGLVKIGPWNAG